MINTTFRLGLAILFLVCDTVSTANYTTSFSPSKSGICSKAPYSAFLPLSNEYLPRAYCATAYHQALSTVSRTISTTQLSSVYTSTRVITKPITKTITLATNKTSVTVTTTMYAPYEYFPQLSLTQYQYTKTSHFDIDRLSLFNQLYLRHCESQEKTTQ